MVAAAFAEAGEFETAREMAPASKNSHKKILLGTEGDTPLFKAAQYSFDACARMGTDLEVLHLIRTIKLPETQEKIAKKNKEILVPKSLNFRDVRVLYCPVFSKDPLEVEIARFAMNRGNILFVVLNKGGGKKQMRGAYLNSLLTNLMCPVVVPQAL